MHGDEFSGKWAIHNRGVVVGRELEVVSCAEHPEMLGDSRQMRADGLGAE
jgi:hypothetical protein